jgi:hypothetical protein
METRRPKIGSGPRAVLGSPAGVAAAVWRCRGRICIELAESERLVRSVESSGSERGLRSTEGGDRRVTGAMGWFPGSEGCGASLRSPADRLRSVLSGRPPLLSGQRAVSASYRPAGAASRNRASRATGGGFGASTRTQRGLCGRSRAMGSRRATAAGAYRGILTYST